MFIINHKKLFFIIAGTILAISIAAIAYFGIPLGIDFTGGSLTEVSYIGARPSLAILQKDISNIPLNGAFIRYNGKHDVVVRTGTLTPKKHSAVLIALSPKGFPATELQFMSVGPSLGSELGRKAIVALAIVILAIVLYITWAFRKVSKPVSSWAYGAVVITILIHDILVPAGFYAILAHFTGVKADSLFVVALLTILGYSVNDTIVIFDRIREHLMHTNKTSANEDFETLVGHSINETMGRSINTSLTVIFALSALALLGSVTTVDFALILLVGVIAGTYSSILLAAPLLIPIEKWFIKKRS